MIHSHTSKTIFEFSQESNLDNWYIVDDVVMGGRSSGSFGINQKGHGVFKGSVSLDNYGGFSSVRHRFKEKYIGEYTKVVLHVKGDGKKYQFRVKSQLSDYYSYVTTFATNKDWQEIEIPLESMYPAYRGRKLNKPNFDQISIEEIAFLIGNKKEEDFELMIDKIWLK